MGGQWGTMGGTVGTLEGRGGQWGYYGMLWDIGLLDNGANVGR